MPEEKRENFFTELLKFIFIAGLIVFPIRLFIAQPFIVSGASMDPTFSHGQYLIVDELSYRFQQPARGDVVIFRPPRSPKEFYIKRIVGLPNETVAIVGQRITITRTDGSELVLEEPYVQNQGNGQGGVFKVGPEEYFVLGDNRPASSDSRVWGTLPRDNIVGRALVRLLPVQQIGIFPGATTPQP